LPFVFDIKILEIFSGEDLIKSATGFTP